MNSQSNQTQKTFISINVIKIIFYLFVFSTVGFALYAFFSFIKPVIFAFIFSYLINPIVNYLERNHFKRVFSILIVFIVIVVLFVLLGGMIRTAIPTVDDIKTFSELAIKNIDSLKAALKDRYDYIDWDLIFANVAESIKSGTDVTEKLPGIVSNLASMSSLFIIIPFCTFFFLLHGRMMKKAVLSLIPNKYFEMSIVTLREVDNVFGSYIRGTLVESLIIGIITGAGLYITGFTLPLSFLAGIVAGLANAIPYVGPAIGMVFCILIHMLGLIPDAYQPIFNIKSSILSIIIVNVAAQVLDNIIIKPMVIGKSVNLHPLVVILGVMAGGSLFGFLGILLAIPVIAIVKVVISTIYAQLKGFNLLADKSAAIVTVIDRDV